MSVNKISFGCIPRKNLNLPRNMAEQVEKKLGIPNTEVDVAELIKAVKSNSEALAKKPVLKLDKWGHVNSTREECEAFIKWIEENGNETEKKLLKTARYNLSQLKEKARELLTSKKEEINPNDPFHVVKKYLMPNTANLMKRAYGGIGPEDICREYLRLQEAARKEAQSSNPFIKSGTNISYDSVKYNSFQGKY